MTNLPEQAHDYGTVEFDEVILTLRDDLIFTLQKLGEHECYLIEDPVNSSFFRIGIPEYTFISLLDGATTVRAALADTSARLGPHAFTTRDAAGICKWLIESQLATTPQSTRAERLRQKAEKTTTARRRQWLNPIMLKVPLLRPDPLLRRLMPVLGGVTGLPFLWLWIGTVLFALYRLVIHWDRATSVGSEILSMDNWLWLAATYIALKLVHETFHAAFCKRFGGEVREAGVLFILFAPIPYVDVTSCWRFRSKWQRIATSAAGMYAELWIAAVATVIWSYSEIGLVRHHAFNAMILGSVTTLFFNANPLMRFDGYYILSDVLGLPNLYSRGQQFVMYLGRRYLMGIKVNPQQASLWRGAVIRTYGVAALLWRIFVCTTLVVAAESLFQGLGLILSLLALILWLAWPLGKFCLYLYRGSSTDRPNRLRFVATTASILCFVFLILRFVPWPGGVQADAFVDYEDAVTVRAAAPGFIQSLHVRAGDRVRQGDLLANLENRQLRADLADVKLAVRQSELRARQFHVHQEIAAEQVEIKTREALVKRLRQLQRQVDNLTIRAPIGGTVVGTELDALPGSYLIEGGELLTIGDESRKQLQLSISQDDVDRFRQALGRDVRIRLRGSNPQTFAASIAHIDPRATTDVPHAAVTAVGGGRLPVRANDRSQPDGSGKWQFLAPRLSASIPLDATRSETLHVGQVGWVKLQDGRESIGGFLRHRLQKWFRHSVRSTLIN